MVEHERQNFTMWNSDSAILFAPQHDPGMLFEIFNKYTSMSYMFPQNNLSEFLFILAIIIIYKAVYQHILFGIR